MDTAKSGLSEPRAALLCLVLPAEPGAPHRARVGGGTEEPHPAWSPVRFHPAPQRFAASGKLKGDAEAGILSPVKCFRSFLCELKKREDKLAFKLWSHCVWQCVSA